MMIMITTMIPKFQAHFTFIELLLATGFVVLYKVVKKTLCKIKKKPAMRYDQG